MLVGSAIHKIDPKGRISLPAGYRKELGGSDLIVVPSPTDKALYVFNPESFEEWLDSLFDRSGGFNPRSRKDVVIRQRILASAATLVIDSAGRINVPKEMREYAHLNKDVAVAGNYDHVEIWDAELYEEAMSLISDEEFSNFFYTE